jgi:CRP-like cAMP-binding protein
MQRSQATEVEHTLAEVAIFARLPSDALKIIRETCSWEHYQPGEPIVDYLDASDDVFFVTTGEVSVTIYSVSGKAVSFRNLGPGSIFGEYAAIDGDPRCASVVAKSDCIVASMSAAAFRKLLEAEPMVGQALIRELVRNVRTLTKRVYEFSTLAVNNRIQAELLRLASLAPREGKSARLVPPPTHADIASRVSTHREAVTRELNRLSRIGLIERQSGVLIVWDVDRLAEMLHEITGE